MKNAMIYLSITLWITLSITLSIYIYLSIYRSIDLSIDRSYMAMNSHVMNCLSRQRRATKTSRWTTWTKQNASTHEASSKDDQARHIVPIQTWNENQARHIALQNIQASHVARWHGPHMIRSHGQRPWCLNMMMMWRHVHTRRSWWRHRVYVITSRVPFLMCSSIVAWTVVSSLFRKVYPSGSTLRSMSRPYDGDHDIFLWRMHKMLVFSRQFMEMIFMRHTSFIVVGTVAAGWWFRGTCTIDR